MFNTHKRICLAMLVVMQWMNMNTCNADLDAAILQTAINQAIAANESVVQLPPGQYQLGSSAMLVQGAENLTIEGLNTTVIATTVDDCYLKLKDCHNVTIRGLTFDMNPLPFTQGTVTAVSADGQTITFEIHAGYPSLQGDYLIKRLHIFEPSAQRLKAGTPDVYLSSLTAVSDRVGMGVSSTALQHSVAVGDRVVLNIRKSAGVQINTSENITLDQMTLYTSAGLGFSGRFIRGDNRVTNCTITPGPTPSGATQPRLMSTTADGLNFAYARQGPVIRNCDFSFMGDDSVNLHGVTFPILQKVSDTQVLVARPYGQESFDWLINADDKVRMMQSPEFRVVARNRVQSFAYVGPADAQQMEQIRAVWTSATSKGSIYRIDFEEPLGSVIGDFLDIPIISASGFEITDNTFHDHRARGLRIMASDGLIARNRFERIKSAAITIGPEYEYWREAGWADNVIVDHNTIIDVGQGRDAVYSYAYALGAISVFFRSELALPTWPMNNSNIHITNNEIRNTPLAGIFIRAAQQVRINNNQLINVIPNPIPDAGSKYHLSVSEPIDINHSCDVTTSENNIQ